MTTSVGPELLRSLRAAADASAARPPRASAPKKAISPYARRAAQRYLTDINPGDMVRQFVKRMGEAGTGLLDAAGLATSAMGNPSAAAATQRITAPLAASMEQFYGPAQTRGGQQAGVLGTVIGSSVGPSEIANLVRGVRAAPEAMLALEHYSPHPIEGGIVNPASKLRGPVHGAERARQAAFPELYPNRSHFMVAGTEVEKPFGSLPVHHGQIPAARVYDVAQDPLDLLPKAQAEATRRRIAGPAVGSLYEQEIQKAGFTAIRRGNIVASFHPVPVQAGRAGAEHQIAGRLASGEGFTLNPRVEMRPFQGTGYLVANPALTQTGIRGADDVAAFLQRADVKAALQDPHAYIGGWKNEVNVSHVLTDRTEALQLGATRGEKAIGHIEQGVYQGDIPAIDPLDESTLTRRGMSHGYIEASNAVKQADRAEAGNIAFNRQFLARMGEAAPAREHLPLQLQRPTSPKLLGPGSSSLTSATEPASEHAGNAAQIRSFVDAGLLTPEEAAPHLARRDAAAAPEIVKTVPRISVPRLSSDQWLDVTGLQRGGAIPSWQELERGLKFPPPGSILPHVTPGSVIGDVPQRDFSAAPWPKTVKSIQFHSDAVRRAFDNPLLADAVQRSVEHGQHLWYATDPIAQSAIDALGPEKGMAAFQRWAQFMGPTSRGTAVPWNVRNASYWFARDAQGMLPTAEALRGGGLQIPGGYVTRTQPGVNAGLAEMASGRPFNPVTSAKISRYAGNIGGNWRGFTLDDPGAQSLVSLGGFNVKPGQLIQGLYGPIESAAQDKAGEFAAEGLLPGIPANRDPTAALQAAMWPQAEGYGYRTLSDEFERAIYRTGYHTNTNPLDVLKNFWQKPSPLF